MSLTGIVLAAGSSHRMGRPKLLLPYGEGTVLDATISAMTASTTDETIVVTGANAEAIEASITHHDVTVVHNPSHRQGNMSSLLAATASVGESPAFVVVPGDMPEVATTAVDQVVDAWNLRRPWAAVTRYDDRTAHPMLLSAPSVAAAAAMAGSKILWRLLVESNDPRVEHLVVDGPAPLDVNTPDDYTELASRRR